MKRNAPTILVLVLLTATATAFVVTQHLKLEPSPISQTHVDKIFSPVCECDTNAAHIDFTISRPARDLEYRLYVNTNVPITLERVELLSATTLGAEP